MQLELYRPEPDASLLKQARDLENYLLKEDGLLINGTVGRGEVWHNDQDGRGRPVGDDVPLHYRGGDVAETCATAYLIRVLERLTRLTGEQRHADVMERAIYNWLFPAIGRCTTESFPKFWLLIPQKCFFPIEPNRLLFDL